MTNIYVRIYRRSKEFYQNLSYEEKKILFGSFFSGFFCFFILMGIINVFTFFLYGSILFFSVIFIILFDWWLPQYFETKEQYLEFKEDSTPKYSIEPEDFNNV
jgi:lipopolysaccharide export LptBFGC system permease protein LptF